MPKQFVITAFGRTTRYWCGINKGFGPKSAALACEAKDIRSVHQFIQAEAHRKNQGSLALGFERA